jgi:hypothetical protein
LNFHNKNNFKFIFKVREHRREVKLDFELDHVFLVLGLFPWFSTTRV